jgi:hypothetical protein
MLLWLCHINGNLFGVAKGLQRSCKRVAKGLQKGCKGIAKGLVFYAEHRRLGGYRNMGVPLKRLVLQLCWVPPLQGATHFFKKNGGVFMGFAHKYPPRPTGNGYGRAINQSSMQSIE